VREVEEGMPRAVVEGGLDLAPRITEGVALRVREEAVVAVVGGGTRWEARRLLEA